MNQEAVPTSLEEQFRTFLGLLTNTMGAIPRGVVEVAREGRVSWANFPKLDLAQAEEIDNWFVAFEARMQAARTSEESYLGRFLECPEVDEDIKARVRTLDIQTYRDLRATLLREHGPLDPVNFYKRALYKVKGSHREEIRKKLMDLFTKLNRACHDEGREAICHKDLCYPFIEAFSTNIKAQLEHQLSLVFEQRDPFEHLFRMAPSQNATLNFVQEENLAKRSAPDPLTEDGMKEAFVMRYQVICR